MLVAGRAGLIARARRPCHYVKFVLRDAPGEGIFPSALSDGVMVTQRPLEALFMVRIHVGQPLFDSLS
jgi:hypothetical protein